MVNPAIVAIIKNYLAVAQEKGLRISQAILMTS